MPVWLSAAISGVPRAQEGATLKGHSKPLRAESTSARPGRSCGPRRTLLGSGHGGAEQREDRTALIRLLPLPLPSLAVHFQCVREIPVWHRIGEEPQAFRAISICEDLHARLYLSL